MEFKHGAHCWATSGPRTCTVTLRCGLENKVLDVAEHETCKYAMIVETPAACTQATVDEALAEQQMLT